MGYKTAELRRTKPRIHKGELVLLYASAPKMALVGYAVVEEIISASVRGLWRTIQAESGVSKTEYNQYFLGADRAFAIRFSCLGALSEPIALQELRLHLDGFRPPQSFRYLTQHQLRALGIDNLAGASAIAEHCAC